LSILVLNGSSRRSGNSELLTEKMLDGIQATRIHLADLNITPIIDKRHTSEGFSIIQDDYESLLDVLISHRILIFSTPLYWYGMSGQMKIFIDRWSQYLRDKRFPFKQIMSEKEAYVIIAGGDNSKKKAIPLIAQFRYIFSFMDISFVDFIIGAGNSPGDVLDDKEALEKAARVVVCWKERSYVQFAKRH
jgi:multimeric flavodoxin WrbA